MKPIIHIYAGRMGIYPKIEAFKKVINRKTELFNLIDNYFSINTLTIEKELV